MVTRTDGSLIFDTKIDTEGFTKGTNMINKQASALKSSISGLGKYISTAFAIGSLVSLSKQAIETASDLQEVQNVVDTAFGSMSYKMEEFADKCIESYGISKLTAKQTGSTFMAMAAGMGLAATEASDMSIALTGLSADMASFYNVTSDVAATALKSIFTGETETLKQFGIVMTEANLQEFALAQGIKKTVSEMNQAEKVQLRYNYVMEKTSMAQGDFAKTSDSWANQTKILKEQFKELLGELGTGLMQVLIPMLRTVNTIVSSLISMANTIGSIMNDLFGMQTNIYGAASSSAGAIADAASGIDGLGDSVDKTATKIDNSTASFDKLEKLASVSVADTTGLDDLSNNLEVIGTSTAKTNIADQVKEATESFDGMKYAIAGIVTTFGTSKILTLFGSLATTIGAFSMTPLGIGTIFCGCLVAIGIAAYDLYQDMKTNDLNERFGDITLSVEELAEAAKTIVDDGNLDKIGTLDKEWADLSGLEQEINGAVEDLNKLNWKVAVGIELSEEEKEQYKQAIETYITNVQKYATEKKEAVLLSLDFLLSGDNKDDIITGTSAFYDSIQGELDKLGRDLSDVVTAAWSDDLLTVDEAKEIQEIQAQMNSIMRKIATTEYTANLEALKIKYAGAELTPDTFKALEESINGIVSDFTDSYDSAMLLTIQDLQLRLAEDPTFDQSDYDAAIEDLKKTRLSNLGTITLNATRFVITSLTDAFSEEIGKAVPDMRSALTDSLGQLMTEDNFNSIDTNRLFDMMAIKYTQGFEGLGTVAKANLESLLALMQPNKEQLEALAADALAAGETVPKNISDGLISIYQMEALSGNLDSVYKILGMYISGSPEYLAMVQNAEASGKNIPDYIRDGIALGYNVPAESVEELFKLLGVSAEEQAELLEAILGTKSEDMWTTFSKRIIEQKAGIMSNVQDILDSMANKIRTYVMPGVVFGAQMAGLDLPNYQYPQYASGTVVPANHAHLAMVGDNRTEPEVISPVSTMKQAVKEAIIEAGGLQNNNTNQTTIVEIDGEVLGRQGTKYINSENKRIGSTFVKGGDYQ